MDISQYTKQQGQFLKASDVTAHPNVVFIMTGDAEFKTSEKFGNERLHVGVTLGEQEFVFDMSKTNARVVEQKLGADTSKWKGHALVLETYKTKTSEGKMTDAINVKEVK
jgi:hypothetical protein